MIGKIEKEKSGHFFTSPAQLAEMLGLSTRRVHQLVKEGVIPAATTGKYSVEQCVKSYIKHISNKNLSESLREEKLLRERVRRRRDEFELAVLQKEYLSREDVLREFLSRVHALRANLMMLPSAFTPGSPERAKAAKTVNKIFSRYSQKTWTTKRGEKFE